MTTFRIKGTSRQIGAIGIFEDFSILIDAESSKAAYEQCRAKLEETREHVLVKQITADWSDTGEYTHVEPAAYLY